MDRRGFFGWLTSSVAGLAVIPSLAPRLGGPGTPSKTHSPASALPPDDVPSSAYTATSGYIQTISTTVDWSGIPWVYTVNR
jgi:hypothetical protein